MSPTATLKQTPAMRADIQQEMRRDEKAWRALAGIWRRKKISDPVAWQKKIRKEWQRALP